MAILGILLKNKRAGEARLAWNRPGLGGRESLDLRSTDVEHNGTIPGAHAGRRDRRSEPVANTGMARDARRDRATPAGRRGCRFPDPQPVRALRLPDRARVRHVARRSFERAREHPGRAGAAVRNGRGYRGPEPIKGHGVHRYVFQLFALATPITSAVGRGGLETARPGAVLAAARGAVLARGRLDGLYSR